jgi:hypothetical protein
MATVPDSARLVQDIQAYWALKEIQNAFHDRFIANSLSFFEAGFFRQIPWP